MSDITNYDFITVDQLAATLQISRGGAYALLKKGEINWFSQISTGFSTEFSIHCGKMWGGSPPK